MKQSDMESDIYDKKKTIERYESIEMIDKDKENKKTKELIQKERGNLSRVSLEVVCME